MWLLFFYVMCNTYPVHLFAGFRCLLHILHALQLAKPSSRSSAQELPPAGHYRKI